MNKPKIVRPEESQPAHALWYDRKKYVTINFMVHKPKDVQVDIQPDKMILCCKNDTDDVFYNVLHFYDKVQIYDSRERVYDRSINVLLRKIKPDYAWPRLQKDEAKFQHQALWRNGSASDSRSEGYVFSTRLCGAMAARLTPDQKAMCSNHVRVKLLQHSPSWISVDFDNWRDWEHEEDEGKEEYDRYVDMIQDMSSSNKGQAPDMGDLSDSD